MQTFSGVTEQPGNKNKFSFTHFPTINEINVQMYGNDPNPEHLNTKLIQILVPYSNRILWSAFQLPLNTEPFNNRTTLNVRILDYSSHLKTRKVWYLNVPNMSGCQKVQFSNGGLKNWTKMFVLWPISPVLEWSP